jgi:hypothetical protein
MTWPPMQKHKEYGKTKQHVSFKSQQFHIKYLNDSETDEISEKNNDKNDQWN